MTEHTKGKLAIESSTVNYPLNIGAKHIALVNVYNSVAIETRVTEAEGKANAEHLVKCWNSHVEESQLKEQRDALRKACENLITGFSESDRLTWASDIIKEAEDAIALE